MLPSKIRAVETPVLLLLAYLCCSGLALGQTAKDFLTICDGDDNARMLCKMYIAGVVDGMTLQADVAKRQPIACVPKDGAGDAERFRRVFVRFVEDNPAAKEQSHRVTVLVALAKAFPCTP
jgi:hypothetical protein